MTQDGETVSEHTKEPWAEPYYCDNEGDEGWWIHNSEVGMEEHAIAVTFSLNPNQEADAKHIVLCVNTCADIPENELKHYQSIGGFQSILSAHANKFIDAANEIDQLKSRNAALEQQLAASEQQRGELVEDLTEILGCFTAAEIEGFHGKLFDMPYEDGNLHGIITRRIIPAWQKAENALAKSQGDL